MNTIRRVTSYYTPAPRGGRPVVGCVIHHTATTTAVLPHSGGSWHYAIGRAGEIFLDVPEEHIAWGVADTDRWRPPWIVPAPRGANYSDANWCCLSIELAYAPQAPHNQVPTLAQEASLRTLLADIYARRGRLAIVGHGEIQSDKWETEPHALNWQAVGCGTRTVNGRYFTQPPEEPMLTPDERTILDAAARQTAAGNTIANGGDLDWWIGTWHELAGQKESLTQLLQKAQQERDAAAAEAERLKAQAVAPAVQRVYVGASAVVRYGNSTEVTVPVEVRA